ncbi:MAG: hypothetical protein Q8Q90_01640 [bacterium]|nr:hypothetical protein [bacterium]
MNVLTKEIGKVLFGDNTPEDLIIIFEQLIAHDLLDQDEEKTNNQRLKILQYCLNNLGVETTARIVVALSLRPDWGGHKWVELLSNEIFKKGLGTAQSFAGSVLGLFRVNALIDLGWHAEKEFRQAFSNAIESAIVCRSVAAKTAIRMADDKYESILSETIKTYVRWKGNEPWQIAYRKNEVETILLNTIKTIGSFPSKFEITPIGNILLDQLSYARFGMFTPWEKAKILATRSYART